MNGMRGNVTQSVNGMRGNVTQSVNIMADNGVVTINGDEYLNVSTVIIETKFEKKVVGKNYTNINLSIKGDCEDVNCENGSVKIDGNCRDIKVVNGSVNIAGSATGNVNTINGNIKTGSE